MPKLYDGEVVYKYEELDSFDQERAMETWRIHEYSNGINDDEFERDYIADVFEALGFDVDVISRKYFQDGTVRSRTYNMYFDWEYYDCFTFKGRYAYQKGWRKEMKEFGNQKELIELGERLQKLQQPYFYRLIGHIDESETRYRAWHNPPIFLEHEEDSEWYDESRVSDAMQEEFKNIVQDLCVWAWQFLKDAYDWIGDEKRALGEDGEFEQGHIYFSEDGTDIYYGVSDKELEDYVDEESEVE